MFIIFFQKYMKASSDKTLYRIYYNVKYQAMFSLSFLSFFIILRTGNNSDNSGSPWDNCSNRTKLSVIDETRFNQRRLLIKNYYDNGDEYNEENFFERVPKDNERAMDYIDEEDDENESQTEDSPQEYFDYDRAKAEKSDDGYEDVDISGAEDKILIKGFCNVILVPSLLLILVSQDLSITNAIFNT